VINTIGVKPALTTSLSRPSPSNRRRPLRGALPDPVRPAARRHRGELTSRLPCDRGHDRGMTRENISLVAEFRNEWVA
jgi:hypothetical protein